MNRVAWSAFIISALILGQGRPFAGVARAVNPDEAELKWWKGNLHTHSLWSDGDDYPEMIVDWYKTHGYHFLALSDHNVLSEGQRWTQPARNRGGEAAYAKYRQRFGDGWVEERMEDGVIHVRLKPLNEFRHRFEQAGEFLLIQSEEISDRFERKPVHLNATNLRHLIEPRGGSSVAEVIQSNVNAVLEQRQATGQLMFPHLNHPNFGYAVTAEDLMKIEGERFFEVYNGHPAVHNDGDATHAGTDRIWDIVLTWRLALLNLDPVFGLAVDDSHNYHGEALRLSNPGRGWVMVRSAFLTPEHIVRAMEAGDFYASTGVLLKNIRADEEEIQLVIEPENGVTYRTLFIGTRRGFDETSVPMQSETGEPLGVTRRYSDEVGEVLAESSELEPRYKFRGDEIYVRAKVISSERHPNPGSDGEVETAWTQPVVPGAF